jgi:ankyrin repeat protein
MAVMISKTRMLDLVKNFRWKDIEAGLAENPDLLKFRDERGRNWLHLCCGVNPKQRKLKPADSVKTARVLLDAGLDVNREAFREGKWRATPLWYAIARGENIALAKVLLEHGSTPDHCLWAAAFRDDVAAIKLLVAAGTDIDAVAEGHTPFLGAVQWSRFKAADALLKLGANVNFQDKLGLTALHYMLKKNSDERHFRTLIKHGARGDLPNKDGVTAGEIMRRKRAPAFQKLATQLSQ